MDIYKYINDKIYIEKENRKTIALIVHPDLTITLKAPLEADNESINKFIKLKII